MAATNIATLGVGIVVFGYLWSLHWDVAGLRERLAPVEGLFEGFARRSGKAEVALRSGKAEVARRIPDPERPNG